LLLPFGVRNHALAEGGREVPRAGDDAYRMIFGHIGICAARRGRWNGLLDVHQTKRSVLVKAFADAEQHCKA
jgi:hypothetical protein